MSPPPVSPAPVRHAGGELDDLTVARILATGADEGEVREAVLRLQADNGEPFGDAEPSERVSALMSIIREEWEAEDEQAEEASLV